MVIPFVPDVDPKAQEPEVPGHMGWPSVLGHRDGSLSCCQGRVSPSLRSLNIQTS